MFNKKYFSAVILAGGSSARMGGLSKQQIELVGIPVAVRSMLAFEQCGSCNEIIVVSRADECALYPEAAKKFGITKYKKVVQGGKTRQESAFIGLNTIDHNAEYIALHDAARCLILPEDIERVFTAAKKYRCAAACTPATDTVKIVKDGKTATSGQPERSSLYYMQTPQIFLTDLYAAAAYKANDDGFSATDDCSVVEHAGFGCVPVQCGSYNMKITTPGDVIIAEALLKAIKEIKS